jgi:DNA-binding NtrC family response regulator
VGETTARILLVDDEESVRTVLSMGLKDYNLEATCAGSAEEALATFVPQRFTLVVIDKNLPGQSGVELARRIRERDDEVALILMTGFGTVDSAVELLHLRVSAYIEKPFDDIHSVVRMFADIVQRRQVRQPRSGGAIDHFKRARKMLGGEDVAAPPSPAIAKLRCLVAVRETGDRDMVARRLERSGHDVLRVSSSGVALAAARVFDLAILDAGLTDPDVHTLIVELRRHSPDVVCAVVLDGPTVKSVARLMELDVRAVLVRPFDDATLERRIDPIVERLLWKPAG